MEKQSTRKFLKLIVALVALFLLGASALMLASCNKDEHQHSYTSSVTTPATCSNPGVETFTCSCGYAYTQIIPATGDHDWQVLQVYPNSCESDGYTVYECSVCHEQKQGDWTAKRDHKYEAVETVEATCTTDGYQIMQCSYCGDRYTDDQYSSEHKATGHKWIANTDAEDPASAEDKKLGFVTVKEADCLNAAQLERKCSVCGETEDKEGAPALGHMLNDKTVEKVPCKVDLSLIDKDGNTGFAFECERENCPVTVTIDNAGNTRHYITASAHKMKVVEEKTFCVDEDSDEVLPAGTNGSGEGHRYEICENCDTYGDGFDAEKNKVTDLAPTGHKWNTVKVGANGGDVVVCEKDEDLDLDAYLDLMEEAYGSEEFANHAADFAEYYGKNSAKGYSRYCSDCGALTVANGHEYVISPLEEGKYEWTDYEKDENGLPVEAEGVTVATMDCRYVQVCKNEGCGKVLERGAHGTISDPTCREDGCCEICGEPFYAQLNHQYINIGNILAAIAANPNDTNKVKPIGVNDASDYTIKQVYDAYKKVSADETWMVPVEGGCEEKSTDVYVCLTCLMTAADDKSEEEVVWNQATALPVVSAGASNPAPAAVKTNAYVITNNFGHEFVPVYYSLDGQEKAFTQITCEIGFNVKYVCEDCGFVFTNVPVADDPATDSEDKMPEGETDKDWYNEARNNKPKKVEYTDPYGNKKSAEVYTDADGFVLDPTKVSAGVGFDAEDLAAALAAKDDNKGDHLITVASEYAKRNGYVASTCVSTAVIPVICENCGANLSYTYTALAADKQGDDNGFTYNTDGDVATVVEKAVDNPADRVENAFNHVEGAKVFACGAHCDAHYVAANGVTYYNCAGFADENGFDATEAKPEGIAAADMVTNLKDASHATVTVSYKFAKSSNYYSDYEINVVTFKGVKAGDTIDWKDGTFSATTKLSVCAGTNSNYFLPKAVTFDNATRAYKHNDVTTTDQSAQGTVTYLVLVETNGNNKTYYPMIDDGTDAYGYALYTEDAGDASDKVEDGNSGTVVNQDDDFFLDVTNAKAPVHAADAVSLKKAFKVAEAVNGVLTVQLAATADFSVDNSIWGTVAGNAKGANSLVIDLNGAKLTSTANIPFDAFATINTITIKNGTFTFTNPTGTAIEVNSVYGLTLTFEDVDIVTTSNAISVAYTNEVAKQSKLILKDSTVTSYGKVGISVDKFDADAVEAGKMATAITLKNTSVIMAKAPTAPVEEQAPASTAMLVGAPVEVNVTNGELAATMQSLVVRGGTVNVSGTKLTLNTYTDATVVTSETASDVENGKKWSEIFGASTTTVDADAQLDSWKAYVNGISSVQTYRMAGLWGNGAEVARAAVVVGNSDTDDYQFTTSVDLSRVSFSIADENVKKIVLGAVYGDDFTKDFNSTDKDGKPVYDPIVTLKVTNSALKTSDLAYTYNTQEAQRNYVKLVGFIAE